MLEADVQKLKLNFGNPFHRVDENGSEITHGDQRANCVHCGVEVTATTTRMQTHLNNCKVHNDRFSEGKTFLSSSTSSSRISDLFTKSGWNKDKANNMTYLFAKGVIVSGHPFDIFENELFTEAFHTLPFNFQPPNASYISNAALNEAYQEIQAEAMLNATQAYAITICSDGWSDRKHNGLHNVMICTPNPFYFSRVHQQTEKADANYVFDILEKGRLAIVKEFEAIKKPVPFLFAYLTDSTNVMRAARVINPDVLGYGCPSHSLNNFSADVAKNPVISNLIKVVSKLHSFFKSSHRPLQYLKICMLKHMNKVQHLPSLGKTRFGSIDTLLSACGSAKEAFIDYSNYGLHDDTFNVELPSLLHACVQSPTFWYSIAAATHFTHQILYGIKYLEGDTVPASANVAVFLFMKKILHKFATEIKLAGFRDSLHFDVQELERLNCCLDRRWLRIRHPVLYLAFMLDPLFICLRCDGVTTLGGENIQVAALEALEWIIALKVKFAADEENSLITKDPVQFKSTIIQQYSEFLMTAKHKSMVTDNKLLHPVVLWGLLQCYWPLLAEHVALPVLSLVASPSAGERNFKVASRVDSDSRVNLSLTKGDKQIACVYNYHQNLNYKNERLPPRDGKFMVLFSSMLGPHSSFSSNDMVQYNEIMATQKQGLLSVNSESAPRRDLDIASISLDDVDFDGNIELSDSDDEI